MTNCTATAKSPVNLCLDCGMCCNGVLFRDVELQQGDDPEILESLGIKLERLRRKTRFAQPCSALQQDCRCSIYSQRPRRCRQFDCRVLQSVQLGELSCDAALRVVRRARQQTDKVMKLMHELGDPAEHLPLAKRFKRLRKRFEQGFKNHKQAEVYARLSLAVHELNLLLQSRFL